MTTSTPAFANPTARWNSRYSEAGYLFGTEPNGWLREHAAVWTAGQRVLSVADGDGRNSVWLARQGLQVDAFDLSEVGVAKAQALAAGHGVAIHTTVADCDSYAWPENTFDGVVAIFVQFADPALRARMFANMVRSLKPGGVLVLQGYGLKQLEFKTGGPDQASHLYTADMLRDSFASLSVVTLREYEADLVEGTGHRGPSALLGLVARKA